LYVVISHHLEKNIRFPHALRVAGASFFRTKHGKFILPFQGYEQTLSLFFVPAGRSFLRNPPKQEYQVVRPRHAFAPLFLPACVFVLRVVKIKKKSFEQRAISF